MKFFSTFFNERYNNTILEENYNRWVYHRTKINPENSSLFNSGIDINATNTGVYGKGLYCTLQPEDDFGYNFLDINKNSDKISHFNEYGEYTIRGKVNYNNFLILDYDFFNEVTGGDEQEYKKHLQKAGLFIDVEYDDDGNIIDGSQEITDGIRKYHQYDPWGFNVIVKRYHEDWKRQGYSGCVFYVESIGDMLVIWDKNKFIPHSYRKSELVFSNEHQNYKLKNSEWLKVTPNIKKILSSDINPKRLKNV